jgi:hypothetical protein
MLEKPLSAEQLYRSILVATGRGAEAAASETDHERQARRAFIARFPELFPSEYNASLQQAAFLSNSPVIDELLQNGKGSTTAQLLAIDSNSDRVRLAFRSILGRLPDADELAACTRFLEGRTADAGVKELLWALLAGAEFQMNH